MSSTCRRRRSPFPDRDDDDDDDDDHDGSSPGSHPITMVGMIVVALEQGNDFLGSKWTNY